MAESAQRQEFAVVRPDFRVYIAKEVSEIIILLNVVIKIRLINFTYVVLSLNKMLITKCLWAKRRWAAREILAYSSWERYIYCGLKKFCLLSFSMTLIFSSIKIIGEDAINELIFKLIKCIATSSSFFQIQNW